ncbi:restriction endonuclease subunit S [Cupriavidus taiwanensis]|uniref:restriction endonuclease subunit S n=1 Tax=Cupriavidus taiwanensis TaxID=164546 RepID=UPI000E1331F5|nr:restriction endonuclease subunit S [Cupriavidus taiwanensis]SPA46756.1 Type-1 restriction enzyme MjaXIP specificity protein [Cupriavidus taiwanensis]
MSDWQTTELGQLAEFRNGLNYSAANAGTGLAVVGVSDFQDNSFVHFATLAELDPSALSTPDALIRKDDILFVRSNGNRELIGRSLLVLSDPPKPTSHSGFTIRLRFTDKRADPRFFAYLLRGGAIRRHLSNQGGGTNINNLNQGILSRLIVPLPPLETQRRIAGILGAYDDLIEVNRRRIAVLEEMARGFFTEWFIRLRFPGYEGIVIEETPDGPLPVGWEIKAIGNTFELLGGGTPSKTVDEYWEEGTVNWFTPTDLTGAKTHFMDCSAARITSTGLAKSSAKLFPAESIMMTSRATIGAIAICTTEACTNQGFITCLPNEDVPRSYLFHWLHQNVPLFIAHATGATFKEITKGVFKRLSILVPNREITAKFEAIVRPMHEMILAAERSNRNLVTTRDLLLPRLVSGQLSVTQAERELEAA